MPQASSGACEYAGNVSHSVPERSLGPSYGAMKFATIPCMKAGLALFQRCWKSQ